MTDKRSAPRNRTFLNAKAIFNNRQSTLDCVVRDMSSTGARLELSEAIVLPDCFDLYVLRRDATYRARITWRHGGEIGVAFENANAPAQSPPDLAARVQHLEAEIGLQRLLISQLRAELDAVKAGGEPASQTVAP
jgi:hypothetical protein